MPPLSLGRWRKRAFGRGPNRQVGDLTHHLPGAHGLAGWRLRYAKPESDAVRPSASPGGKKVARRPSPLAPPEGPSEDGEVNLGLRKAGTAEKPDSPSFRFREFQILSPVPDRCPRAAYPRSDGSKSRRLPVFLAASEAMRSLCVLRQNKPNTLVFRLARVQKRMCGLQIRSGQIEILPSLAREGRQTKRRHRSASVNSAIFISARSNPILSGRLPWIGITIRSRRPGMTKTWWLPRTRAKLQPRRWIALANSFPEICLTRPTQ